MKRLTEKDWAELRKVSRALRDADAGTVGLTIPASGLAELFDELEALKSCQPLTPAQMRAERRARK